ncbi:hypothetical protein ENSA5_54250 [Enhygromyxa salina]|uniref:Uncharacterized protein n=1 Tax=Enhygromyxa salina TaxID=215803 RepID=A0A2S9XFB2_9BACT|nr:hypothetical protein [Enhygromyxa salina]PRP91549.1 hypothetical protein ENSA5_54250 [Enhygromyxa salina]
MSGHARWRAAALAVSLVLVSGCGGALVKLAKDREWAELDRRARAQKQAPRGKAARAWAQALVELDKPEEARAVLLRDFRSGGQEPSLLALAKLERELGLLGVAAAHYTRLGDIDLDALTGSPEAELACDLLRRRARAQAELGEALAADLDMRRLALWCPEALREEDRGFLSSIQPGASAQAEGQRSLDALAPKPEAIATLEAQLADRLELARKRGPRAVVALAEAEGMQVEPDDVAVLLAAEFGGALGPGLMSSRRLSAWIGDTAPDDLLAAIDTLPDGAREYALLRLTSVRELDGASDSRQGWIVAAMASLGGQGPHEAAKAWRVAASVGDLSGAEFALNTNLRDMIPVAVEAEVGEAGDGGLTPAPAHWSQRVPVDRRSFDLLLTLARLLEHRGQAVLALELRRAVLVAGHEVGLAQVTASAVEEVRRQLVLGHPWQALALAEVVPGPLLDEILLAVASALGLSRAAGLDEAEAADRNVVWRSLGDPWFERWDPRLDVAVAGLHLDRDDLRCPELGRWLDPEADEELARVGLDPVRARAAVEAAIADLGAPATGVELARALESDLALSCTAPLVNLLHAGPHELALATLDERLIHAPELGASTQLQLHAELALAHGQTKRATLLTISAAAQTTDPRGLWARAAVAGRSFGAREYSIDALRQVLAHSDGLDDSAARRELVLLRLRDVDGDAIVREGDPAAVDAVREQLRIYVDEAPRARQWSRVDRVLWMLASEARADALAWERLIEIVVDEQLRARHPEAVSALERAAAGAGATLVSDPGIDGDLAFLSDSDALCARAASRARAPSEDASPSQESRQRLVGAATTCAPRARADALAALISISDPGAQTELRQRVLAGPIAAEINPDRPGVARTVAALDRPGAALRVVFDLPLDPVWVVDGPW